MKKVDFHIHTNLSDGMLSPQKVVELAKNNGCTSISITDHDTISDFSKLAKDNDIEIIPGIEFNTSVSSMHILGYGILDIPLVDAAMTKLYKQNEDVCYKVIDMMNKAGYDISVGKITDYLKEINLKHDILDKRRIVKYLIHKGYASNTIEAYDKLIGKAAKFYVPNYKVSPIGIIKLISFAGGISILAHPYTIKLPYELKLEMIKDLIHHGLAGIEIVNGDVKIDNKLYLDLTSKYNLIETLGSDFHDSIISNIGYEISDDVYEKFQKKLILKK